MGKKEYRDHREEAFLSAYEQLQEPLFRHCYFRLYNRERARELVQEAFIRTWEYMGRGNEIENLRAFLYRVAHNLIIDDVRKRKAVSLEELAETGFDPPMEDRELAHLLSDAAEARRAVDRLRMAERDLIVMRYIDGLGPKDIAQIMGISENVISVRLHRAMTKLRDLFPAREEEQEQRDPSEMLLHANLGGESEAS